MPSEGQGVAPRRRRRAPARNGNVASIEQLRALTQLRNAASTLVSRGSLGATAGMTYGGDRDLYKALGYQRHLIARDYWDRYLRNAVAARVVEALPDDTWRGSGDLVEIEDPDKETPFETAWHTFNKRLRVWPVLRRLDVLAGLGRYSVMLIGAPGDLGQPLPRLRGPQDVLYLSPYGEKDVAIQEHVQETADARYGLPLLYSVKLSTGLQRAVHWTRVVHVADGLLDDDIYGQPRLQRIWNLLDDLEKVTGGGAEAFWRRAHQGYVLSLDKDAEVSAAQLEDMKQQIEEFAHGFRRSIGQQGGEFKALGSDVASIDKNADAIVTQISAGTKIPKRILMGSERGELASTQDSDAWDLRVEDRRNEYAEPVVVRQLVDRLISVNGLPAPAEYHVHWPTVEALSEDERAEIAGKWAKLNADAGETVVTGDEIRDKVLLLPPLADVTEPGDTVGGLDVDADES